MQKYKQVIFETNKGIFKADIFLEFNPYAIKVSAVQESILINGMYKKFNCDKFVFHDLSENLNRVGFMNPTEKAFEFKAKVYRQMKFWHRITIGSFKNVNQTINQISKMIVGEMAFKINSIDQWEVE